MQGVCTPSVPGPGVCRCLRRRGLQRRYVKGTANRCRMTTPNVDRLRQERTAKMVGRMRVKEELRPRFGWLQSHAPSLFDNLHLELEEESGTPIRPGFKPEFRAH